MILIHGHRGMRSPHRGVAQSVTGSSVTAIPRPHGPVAFRGNHVGCPCDVIRRSFSSSRSRSRGRASRSRSEPLDIAG